MPDTNDDAPGASAARAATLKAAANEAAAEAASTAALAENAAKTAYVELTYTLDELSYLLKRIAEWNHLSLERMLSGRTKWEELHK
jgi:hypothetical protein